MRITKQADYAIRVVKYLSIQPMERIVTVEEVSKDRLEPGSLFGERRIEPLRGGEETRRDARGYVRRHEARRFVGAAGFLAGAVVFLVGAVLAAAFFGGGGGPIATESFAGVPAPARSDGTVEEAGGPIDGADATPGPVGTSVDSRFACVRTCAIAFKCSSQVREKMWVPSPRATK